MLLENGDQYYLVLFVVIGCVSWWVIFEFFIWFEDEVGWWLYVVLFEVVCCGIQVEVFFDGYGFLDFSDEFVGEFIVVGVIFCYYDLCFKLMGMCINLFCCMYCKIVVIDDIIVFVGGINYFVEYMSDYGLEVKQDYVVQVEGLVVFDILQFELENLFNSEIVCCWW